MNGIFHFGLQEAMPKMFSLRSTFRRIRYAQVQLRHAMRRPRSAHLAKIRLLLFVDLEMRVHELVDDLYQLESSSKRPFASRFGHCGLPQAPRHQAIRVSSNAKILNDRCAVTCLLLADRAREICHIAQSSLWRYHILYPLCKASPRNQWKGLRTVESH